MPQRRLGLAEVLGVALLASWFVSYGECLATHRRMFSGGGLARPSRRGAALRLPSAAVMRSSIAR